MQCFVETVEKGVFVRLPLFTTIYCRMGPDLSAPPERGVLHLHRCKAPKASWASLLGWPLFSRCRSGRSLPAAIPE